MDGPFNVLGATANAFGVQTQLLIGRPVTVLVDNYEASDDHIKVQSTLGFLPQGRLIFPGGVLVYYRGKTPTRFTDLFVDHLKTFPDMTLIVSDTRWTEPDAYKLFWDYPWAGNDYGIEW